MEARTVGAICLGPTGNEQGGHYFMSLLTGRRLTQNRWTELPMLNDAIAHVGELGRCQGMPKSLTFADRYGHEIRDVDGDVDDEHDSTYNPADDDDSVSTESSASYDSDDDDSDDDNDDDNDSQPRPALTAGVDDDDEDDDDSEGGNDGPPAVPDDHSLDDSIPGSSHDSESEGADSDNNDNESQ
jgi:hypothetical protein